MRVSSLDLLTARHQAQINKLLALRSEVEIRATLLESALGRYAASSTVSITEDSNIEIVDWVEICGVGIDLHQIWLLGDEIKSCRWMN